MMFTEDDLLKIAKEAARREPGGSYGAKDARARCFVAMVCGFMSDEAGNEFARAIEFQHLVTTPAKVAA